jgi:hypothetical protein
MAEAELPTARGSPRVGESAVILYMLATYAPQFVLHVLDENALTERFRIGTGAQWLAGFAPLFLLLTLVLQRWLPTVRFPYRLIGKIAGRAFESRLNTIFGLALISLAVIFLLRAGLTFRQTGANFSDAGLSVVLLIFCKPYVYGWLIYRYLVIVRGAEYRPRLVRLQAAQFLIALVISITGSLDVLPIAWSALLVFSNPYRLRSLFVASRDATRRFMVRALLILLGIPTAIGLAVVIVTIGYIDKMGADEFAFLLEQQGVERIIAATMVRASSSYASMISFVENNLTNYDLYQQVLAIPVENFPYRLSLVFRPPLPRPEITQITRLNFVNYEPDPSFEERAGASPGLVASAFYAAPFPLGFILLALYVVLVIRIVNLPFASLSATPKIATVVLCVSFIYPLFESPLDYLLVLDPSVVQLAVVLGAFMAAAVVTPNRSTVLENAPHG